MKYSFVFLLALSFLVTACSSELSPTGGNGSDDNGGGDSGGYKGIASIDPADYPDTMTFSNPGPSMVSLTHSLSGYVPHPIADLTAPILNGYKESYTFISDNLHGASLVIDENDISYAPNSTLEPVPIMSNNGKIPLGSLDNVTYVSFRFDVAFNCMQYTLSKDLQQKIVLYYKTTDTGLKVFQKIGYNYVDTNGTISEATGKDCTGNDIQ